MMGWMAGVFNAVEYGSDVVVEYSAGYLCGVVGWIDDGRIVGFCECGGDEGGMGSWDSVVEKGEGEMWDVFMGMKWKGAVWT